MQDDLINGKGTMSHKVKITSGSKTFIATLFENPTAASFIKRLPFTINMIELNGNEKYYNFSSSLPVNSSNPGTIHSGDLMIWGSNSLVLFYQNFATSYSYTRLGRIDDPSGLEEAMGSGDIMIQFELQ